MFTGLIEDIGAISGLRPQGDGRRIAIRTAIPLHEVKLGDSIAVNGACLTAETLAADVFEVVAGRETLERTTVGDLRVGQHVHLERALRLGDRLDGHLVQGHVDGIGRVIRAYDAKESWVLWLELPTRLSRYVAEKGSICLQGVSLTVNEVSGPTARVNIVPHTRRATRLADLRPGDRLNVEVDVLAKYVERMVGPGDSSGSETWQKLGLGPKH